MRTSPTKFKSIANPASRLRTAGRPFVSMASKTPIPIITTGRSENIGQIVNDSLKPDFEVIHFTLASAVETELPLLMSGEPPSSPSSTLGTGNWAAPPRALVFGGAYTDEDIARMSKLVDGMPGARKIPWIRVAPPGPTSPPIGPEYAVHVAGRILEGLKALEGEGKLVEGKGGVHIV